MRSFNPKFSNKHLNELERFEITCAINAIIRARDYVRSNSRSTAQMALRHALDMLNDLRKGK